MLLVDETIVCAGFFVCRLSRQRNFFPINAPGMGRFQMLNLGVLGYGLELRFWGSDCNNRFPNTNHNLNHNSNDNIPLNPKSNPKLTLTLTLYYP